MTVTQLAEVLGIPPNKVHYHVRELERVGLVRLVETREKGGILEKYYRPVARNFKVPDDLLRTTPPDEMIAAVNEFLQVVNQGLLDALRRDINAGRTGGEVKGISAAGFWATNAEATELVGQINRLIRPYEHRRGLEGEREHRLAHFAYALASESTEVEKAAEASTSAGLTLEVTSPVAHRPRRRRIFVAGVTSCTRAQLEEIVAAGEQADMRLFGSCTFTDDIPPELVEQAIARFRLRGVLNASPAVGRSCRRKKKAQR